MTLDERIIKSDIEDMIRMKKGDNAEELFHVIRDCYDALYSKPSSERERLESMCETITRMQMASTALYEDDLAGRCRELLDAIGTYRNAYYALMSATHDYFDSPE